MAIERGWYCRTCETIYAEYCNGCPRCHFGEPGTDTSLLNVPCDVFGDGTRRVSVQGFQSQLNECGAEMYKQAAELARLRAEVERLRSIKITIDTPNEVCDGYVHDTIANIVDSYGEDALTWIMDGADELTRAHHRAHGLLRERDAATRRAELLATLCRAWDNSPVGKRMNGKTQYEGDGFDELRAARRAVDEAGALGGA